MQIFVNGEPRELPANTTLASLLAELEVPARGTAVEINLEVVPRKDHAERTLHDGDRLEIVSFVGGG